MKILHLAGAKLSGGATRGAYWLHKGLLAQGVESRIMLNDVPINDPTVISIAASKPGQIKRVFRSQLDQIMVRKLSPSWNGQAFSPGYFGYNVLKSEHYAWADIIHPHWINWGAFDMRALKHSTKPVIWTMRDMWPMTGGCHYSMNCTNYINGCGQCPVLGSRSRRDLSSILAKRKKQGLPSHFKAVAISHWLADCAAQSYIMGGQDISVIPNAIDKNSFFPLEKQSAREILGLPLDRPIVLFGHSSNELYKGIDVLFEALKRLSDQNFPAVNVAIGSKSSRKPQFELINLGYLSDDISLRLAYSAADVFVAASKAEAFGKMLIEAMACGTPVVAFDATGPSDIVAHKETGYLAKPFQADDLANGIKWVLADPERHKTLCLKAIERVDEHFILPVVAKQYMSLYKKILDASS